MNTLNFEFAGAALTALGSGALYWAAQDLLVVSDLHFGKSARLAQVGGAQLPPYETRETLQRLQGDLERTQARCVICLGDSFDDGAVEAALPEADLLCLLGLMAGRNWTWIEGNHDPGPVSLGGVHQASVSRDGLVFRHIATVAGTGEVSGHYHPKIQLGRRGRACFLLDDRRLILPAYGVYTGGLRCESAVLSRLMAPGAQAIVTGPRLARVPMPRRALA